MIYFTNEDIIYSLILSSILGILYGSTYESINLVLSYFKKILVCPIKIILLSSKLNLKGIILSLKTNTVIKKAKQN